MTPEKLKDMWAKMRVQLNILMSKWKRSGNSEGTRGDDIDDEDSELGGCNKEKQNFLGSYGPHILYLWEHS